MSDTTATTAHRLKAAQMLASAGTHSLARALIAHAFPHPLPATGHGSLSIAPAASPALGNSKPSNACLISHCPRCSSLFVPGVNCFVAIKKPNNYHIKNKKNKKPIPQSLIFLKLNKYSTPTATRPKLKQRQRHLLNNVVYKCCICNSSIIMKGAMKRDRDRVIAEVKALSASTTIAVTTAVAAVAPVASTESATVDIPKIIAPKLVLKQVNLVDASKKPSQVEASRLRSSTLKTNTNKGDTTSLSNIESSITNSNYTSNIKTSSKKIKDAKSSKFSALQSILASKKKDSSNSSSSSSSFNLDDFLL
ncbi:hypothetical protein HK100_005535 [Physocladia obscura]|uniref:Uncharacterized protein n=1 Tax=Physocladia obscura TaxID=109957 RepID=A0AAD5ST10_9FUNG|nr:hypothetical protein HK100_005535 [Physocladia obscura]